MKLVKYYRIMQWDGGQHHNGTDIAFATVEAAKDYLEMNKHDIYQQWSMFVYDDMEDYAANKKDAIIKTALDKLTEVEKKMLGLA